MLGLAFLLLESCRPPGQPLVGGNGPITGVTNIKINGVNYATPAAALDAERQTNDKVVAALTHEADPIKGRARIVLPDHDRLRPLMAQVDQQALKRLVAGDALEFSVSTEQLSLRELADGLVASGAFQEATIAEQNEVLNPDFAGADFLVWYEVRTAFPNNAGPWVGRWQVRRAGSPMRLGASMDMGTAPGARRLASFVKSVREAALRLGGSSVAGVTAANLTDTGVGLVAGSGTVIGTKGYVVTNEHVVRGCTAPKVSGASKIAYTARIVASDATNDLALLKVEHGWQQAASLRDGHEPQPGEAVMVAGYPLPGIVANGLSVTSGSVTSLAGPRGDTRQLQISAPVQPGNSGGPLLDASGQVAGIVSGTLNGTVVAMATGGVMPQNVNFAIKADILRSFLDAQGVASAHGESTHALPPVEIAARAQKFTVHIECRRG
jgi:hypothetical protein